MPLISVVGQRSPSIRLLLAGIYLLLALGAVTMVYPFALMISTATTSKADSEEFQLIPAYWRDRFALFKKYLVDAAPVDELAVWFGHDDWFEPADIRPEQLRRWFELHPERQRQAMARDWRQFLISACPGEFRMPLFQAEESPLGLREEYLAWLRSRYGDLAKMNSAYGDNAMDWGELVLPPEQLNRQSDADPRTADWRRFLAGLPPERAGILNLDVLAYRFALLKYGDRRQLLGQTGFDVDSMTLVNYDAIAGQRLGAEVREQFLREQAPMRFVQVDAAGAGLPWREFLEQRGDPAGVAPSERMPAEAAQATRWAAFVQKACPPEALSVARPESAWWEYLRKRYGEPAALSRAYGTSYASFEQVRIPEALASIHYETFQDRYGELWWRYFTYNFWTVVKFIAVHGQAAQVTLIYILLLIATTLTVNPLAAYAMSRFRLRETHHLLIVLLVPMAFPAEVLMIPSFLMIKTFPLAAICLVALCALVFILLRRWLARRMPLVPGLVVALGITVFLSGWLLPRVAARYDLRTSVSLMNTFWALILPGLANGFGIFLLKGFFDSLPPELFEAALIDGSGELRMFWQIALPLVKPILAVMALGAFTAGYGSFMHAFLVCQDPKMWTLMVFLYEFQQSHGIQLVMASLVLAAVPTLIVFLFCQNIILRGIVIPSFK